MVLLVPSTVTVRAAVRLKVRWATSPALLPAMVLPAQLAVVLQLPAASTFQVPLAAWDAVVKRPRERLKKVASREVRIRRRTG